MSTNLKHILVVASSTMGSRLLGFLRDILLFSFFGAGLLNSAFILAFTLPNLLRRLLGEGALTSAVVPVLSDEFEKKDDASAYEVLNKVITRVALLLLALVIVGMILLSLLATNADISLRWQKASELAVIMLPYMLLICVSALFAAVLNVQRKFAVAALSPVWLNLCMIFSLAVLGYFLGGDDPEKQLYYLCGGVLAGGFFQMFVPAMALYRLGWRPNFDLKSSPAITEIMTLFVPGVLGAAVFQINIVTSRLIAFSLNESAVSVLYLANRLVELPLGVFAVAVTTVIFPRLASLMARGDHSGMRIAFTEGLRMILAITVPAALGLIFLREPIIGLCFQWGAFDETAVEITKTPLLILSIGLPFYALAIYLTRALHAVKDMRTPLNAGIVSFGANVLLSLLLMFPFGTNGLAAANVLSVVLQVFLLYRGLVEKENDVTNLMLVNPVAKILISGGVMAIFTHISYSFISAFIEIEKTAQLFGVLLIIPLSVLLYFAMLWFVRYEDRDAVAGLVGKILPFKR